MFQLWLFVDVPFLQAYPVKYRNIKPKASHTQSTPNQAIVHCRW